MASIESLQSGSNFRLSGLLCFVSSPSFLQDMQSEVPSHLLRLKVDVERSRVAVILQDCRAELHREMQALSGTCTSERVIKEHRVSLGFSGKLKQIELKIRERQNHLMLLSLTFGSLSYLNFLFFSSSSDFLQGTQTFNSEREED